MKSRIAWWSLGIFLVATVAAIFIIGNSEYLLGCRYADEIVAAGEELMALAEKEGTQIRITHVVGDPRVPPAIKMLDPANVDATAEGVYIYTGGHSGKGFFIFKEPHEEPPVGNDGWRINSRLWWYEGA